MGCGCSKRSGRPVYILTLPNGTKMSYASEIEAKMAQARKGGTVAKSL